MALDYVKKERVQYMKGRNKRSPLLLGFLLLLAVFISGTHHQEQEKNIIKKDGCYTCKEDVAAYIHEYGCLPSNFMTKKEAQKLGWDSEKGNLNEVAPGKCIGGDRFGNYEELLPVKKGRKYYECDIDYESGFRGPKRLIYSNDGLIYYTEDHYKTFEQLYEDE